MNIVPSWDIEGRELASNIHQDNMLYNKTGVCRGIPIFLLQNIDCGNSLELPRRGGSNVYPQSMF